MRILKTGIAVVLCSFIVNSQFVFAEKCSEVYNDKKAKTTSDIVFKQAFYLVLGGFGVISSIVGTALTAGIAAPITIPIGIASIGFATGKTAYDGYSMKNPVEQYFNNRRVHQLVVDSYNLFNGKNPKGGDTLTKVYAEKFANPESTVKAITMEELARQVTQFDMDRDEALCTITELPFGEGRFFIYQPIEHVLNTIMKSKDV